MHVLTEQELNERWRQTLAAGVLRRSPFFLEFWIWFSSDCMGVAFMVERAYRHPGARADLLLLLGTMVGFWLATGYVMLKLWRYTRSEIERQNNPTLLHASYLGFKVYQAYLATWFFVCILVADFTATLCR